MTVSDFERVFNDTKRRAVPLRRMIHLVDCDAVPLVALVQIA